MKPLAIAVFLTLFAAVAPGFCTNGAGPDDTERDSANRSGTLDPDVHVPELAMHMAPLFDRIGARDPMVRLFQDGRYAEAMDQGWQRIHRGGEEQRLDDLFLLVGEAAFRLSRGDEAAGEHAREALLYGLNRFADSPNDPIRLFRIGQLLCEEGFFPEAEGYLSAFLDMYPNDPIAVLVLATLGRTLREDGDLVHSVEVYLDGVERAQTSHERLAAGLGLARTYYEIGMLDDALYTYREALHDPEDLRRFTDRDLYYYSRSEFQVGSRSTARKGLALLRRLHPDTPYRAGATYLVGMDLLESGDRKGAIAHFEEVLEEHPDAREACIAAVRLGSLLVEGDEGEQERAVALFEESRSCDHGRARLEALNRLGRIAYKEGDDVRSLALTGDLLNEVQDNPYLQEGLRRIQKSYSRLAGKAFASGDFPAVYRTFSENEDNLVNDLLERDTLDLVGRSQIEKFRFDGCRRLFERELIVKRFPELAGYYRSLVELVSPDGAGRAALETFAADTTDPSLAVRAGIAIGDALRAEGDDLGALAAYRRARERSPSPASKAALLRRIAWLNLQHGDAAAALADYRRLASMESAPAEHGADEEAVFGMAESLYQTGQRASARERFEGFVEAYPDSPLALQARVRVAQCIEKNGGTVAEAAKWLKAGSSMSSEQVQVLQAFADTMAWRERREQEKGR